MYFVPKLFLLVSLNFLNVWDTLNLEPDFFWNYYSPSLVVIGNNSHIWQCLKNTNHQCINCAIVKKNTPHTENSNCLELKFKKNTFSMFSSSIFPFYKWTWHRDWISKFSPVDYVDNYWLLSWIFCCSGISWWTRLVVSITIDLAAMIPCGSYLYQGPR